MDKVIFFTSLFYGCSSLKSLPDISNWNINDAIYLNGMFMECSSLEKLTDISNRKFIKNYNIDIIQNLINLFCYYKNKLSNIGLNIEKINDFISSFCQFKFDNIFYIKKFGYEFGKMKSFDDIVLKLFPELDYYDYNLFKLINFYEKNKDLFKSILIFLLPKFPEPRVDIGYLFAGCSSLKSLPIISKWNTKNVKNISGLFAGCSSLKSIPDISNWDTGNVEIMSSLFYGCTSLKKLPDISNWKIEYVFDISSLFCYCPLLCQLPDISK